MKNITPKIFISLVLAVSVVALGTLPAYAHDGHDHGDKVSVEQRKQGRLDDARKRVCAARSEKIIILMNHMADHAQRNLATFAKITERIKAFYIDKELSAANYDALIAEIESKKMAAETLIQSLKSLTAFDCNSDNPVGKADEFRNKAQELRKALKDYRTAIRTLLIAVKQAAGDN